MNTKMYLAVLPFLLAACSPDSTKPRAGQETDGYGSVFGSMPIHEDNQDALVAKTIVSLAIDDDLRDPFGSYTSKLFTHDSTNGKPLSALVPRAVHCDSGSAAITTSGEDIGTGIEPVDGFSSFTARYNDCVLTSRTDGGTQISTHIDGTLEASIEWSGYRGDGNTFDSYILKVLKSSFYMSSDHNGARFAMESDTSSVLELSDNTVTLSYTGTEKLEDLGDGNLAVESITPVTAHYSVTPAHPFSGEVLVSGGGDSSIRYTVVSGGVEVSVNGGQAALYPWAEIRSMPGAVFP